MWNPRLSETARMKYLGIVEALEADIRSGRVQLGERLPPQRTIADTLEVDLTTVTRAFNEARRRGLIAAQAGRGTFISEKIEGHRLPRSDVPSIDLSMNIPPQPANIDFRKLMSHGISDILERPGGLLHLHYQESNGTEVDRAAGAHWLSRRIADLSVNRIAVTPGAQSALFAVCALLLKPGDTIMAGATTYPGLKTVAAQQKLTIKPLSMDEQGITPDSFERACQEKSPKAFYVIPTIDNPTTSTMSASRRREIVALARKYSIPIIEDDPYSPLLPMPVITFAELARDLTWHIATLSKCATPALRIAYLIAPSPNCALRLASVLRATTIMPPPLMSALAARWIGDGTLESITKSIIAENTARQNIAASILDGIDYASIPQAPHLWLRLPEGWHARSLTDHAARIGISIIPSSAFSTGTPQIEAVRLSLGVAPDHDTLAEALTQLVDLIATPPALDTLALV